MYTHITCIHTYIHISHTYTHTYTYLKLFSGCPYEPFNHTKLCFSPETSSFEPLTCSVSEAPGTCTIQLSPHRPGVQGASLPWGLSQPSLWTPFGCLPWGTEWLTARRAGCLPHGDVKRSSFSFKHSHPFSVTGKTTGHALVMAPSPSRGLHEAGAH